MSTLYALDDVILQLNNELDRTHNPLNRLILKRRIETKKLERADVYQTMFGDSVEIAA